MLLHGAVYAPPYRVAAIGDAAGMQPRFESDGQVERFRVAAAEFQLGFDVARAEGLSLPAFRGVVSVSSAHVT